MLKVNNINYTSVDARVNWSELQRLLQAHVLGKVGEELLAGKNLSYVMMSIEQQTTGSPPYRINEWEALVEFRFEPAKVASPDDAQLLPHVSKD